MKKLLGVSIGMLALCGLAFWWLLLDGSLAEPGEGMLSVDKAETLVLQNERADWPTELRVEIIGTDVAPAFAAQVGSFGESYRVAFSAFQIVWPDGRSMVIGGAVDKEFADETARKPEEATFDPDAYARLLQSYREADDVYVTHGHSDHVIAIARHNSPSTLAEKLRLTKNQRDELAKYKPGGKLPVEYSGLELIEPKTATLIAPGVVLIPTPGHTRSSQSFYVALQDGREYLLIGDIVWLMSNIETLKTRPRILQYVLFDPAEDREAVLSQIGELRNVTTARLELIILPSHDRDHFEKLVERGDLDMGFQLTGEQ